MTEIVFVKDSREPEAAWDLYFTGQTVTKCLQTGDYSLVGCEDIIGIERKTIDDLVGCLGKQRDRFERELQRAQSMEYFAVIVESSYFELEAGLYRSRLHPRSGVESVSAFEVRYKIPFLFCGNQELAALKCESLLRKFHRERMKEAAAIADCEIPF